MLLLEEVCLLSSKNLSLFDGRLYLVKVWLSAFRGNELYGPVSNLAET